MKGDFFKELTNEVRSFERLFVSSQATHFGKRVVKKLRSRSGGTLRKVEAGFP